MLPHMNKIVVEKNHAAGLKHVWNWIKKNKSKIAFLVSNTLELPLKGSFQYLMMVLGGKKDMEGVLPISLLGESKTIKWWKDTLDLASFPTPSMKEKWDNPLFPKTTAQHALAYRRESKQREEEEANPSTTTTKTPTLPQQWLDNIAMLSI